MRAAANNLAMPADIQDRDGSVSVFEKLGREVSKLHHVFADGGYAGPELRTALIGIGCWTIQIIKRSDTAEGFEVLPRRWVLQRTFARLGCCRRLAKDWEKSIESAEAWVLFAHIRCINQRLPRA